MPYKSKAQAAKFHILEKEGKIKPSVVDEYDKASKGMKLPNKVGKPMMKESSESIPTMPMKKHWSSHKRDNS